MYQQIEKPAVHAGSLLERLLNNFYYRNLGLLILLLSGNVAQKIFMAGFSLSGFLCTIALFTALYATCMFHNLVLYSKLLKQQRFILYLLGTLLTLVVFNELISPPIRALFRLEWNPESLRDKMLLLNRNIIYLVIGLVFYLSYDHLREREARLRLEKMAADLELRQLREHLNPHFLFNALNNIYSYTVVRDLAGNPSARYGELILKLSELMRFIIEKAPEDLILFSEEMDFISNYIAFEEERLGPDCRISLQVRADDDEFQLPPFLLFVFVENAIKHGTRGEGPSNISISVRVAARELVLRIDNPMAPAEPASTGTGLTNTKRRLDILYPKRHSLQLAEKDGRFITELRLRLSTTSARRSGAVASPA